MNSNWQTISFLLILVLTHQQSGKSLASDDPDARNQAEGGNMEDGRVGGWYSYTSISPQMYLTILFGVVLGILVSIVVGSYFYIKWRNRQEKFDVDHHPNQLKYKQKIEKIVLDDADTNLKASVALFSQLLQATKNSQGKFIFLQKNKELKVKLDSFNFQKSKTKLHFYDFTLNGTDSLGSWSAVGQFIYTKEGPYFWFRKSYQNRLKLGYTGQKQVLLFELTHTSQQSCEGIWFFNGIGQYQAYSGKWQLSSSRMLDFSMKLISDDTAQSIN